MHGRLALSPFDQILGSSLAELGSGFEAEELKEQPVRRHPVALGNIERLRYIANHHLLFLSPSIGIHISSFGTHANVQSRFHFEIVLRQRRRADIEAVTSIR